MIKQRYPYDCAIACMAMFLGLEWEQVFDAFGKPTAGIPINKSAEYLWKNGMDVEWFDQQMPKRKALVVVESLNQPPKRHMIYFDGTNFHDPSTGSLLYRTWSDVLGGIVGVLE